MREYEERRFKSSDGVHECYTVIMRPDGVPKGIFQISHGMCEHIGRYLELMSYLADRGYVVCGNDHLGHGRTAKSPDELGYFGNGENGWKYVLTDIHRLTSIIKAEYPGVPLVLLGHSMGSFLARAYAVKYGSECCGFIFMGTSDAFEGDLRALRSKTITKIDKVSGAIGTLSPKIKELGNKFSYKIDGKLDGKEKYVGRAGLALMLKETAAIAKIRGDKLRSKALYKVAFGRYNDHIRRIKTGYEWLSRDEKFVNDFVNDPLCKYLFTVNGWQNIASMLWYVSDDRWYQGVPKTTPVVLMSGMEDPVGSWGKGVRTVFKRLLDEGCAVRMRLYEGARHELYNELNRDKIYEDIAGIVDEMVSGAKKEAK